MRRPGSCSIEAFKRARHLRDSRHNVTSVTSCEHISSFSCHLCRWRTKAVCCRLKKKKTVPKLGQPVQNSQMVPVFLEGGGCFLNFHIFIYLFLSKFCLEKKRGRGASNDVWERRGREKNSGKLNVTSHVTNWIASNRKSVAIASDKPLSRETAGSWQTREHLKGTEAFGC